jgi:protein-disulfide isomerase
LDQRRKQLIAIGVFAVVVVAVAIVVSLSGGDSDEGGSSSATLEQIDGLPQEGTVLGDPDAPATLTEWGDLQCPFCRDFAVDVLPTVLSDYVESGDVNIDFQTIAILGPDSEIAARMAYAVAEQGYYWQFVDLFYENQGTENSGYVSEEFLTGIAEQIDGLDVDQALADRESPAVAQALADAQARADDLGVSSTPSFAVSEGGGKPQVLELESLDPQSFSDQLDGALGTG